jgi:hypothetical protein
MFHPPPGTSGVLAGCIIFVVIGPLVYYSLDRGPFNLDPQGIPGTFEPFLAKYLRVGEFIVGLAAGSIVLLVGSSALHNPTGSLPWSYASPLYLLGCCVLYGIAFMVWLIYHYEDYLHGAKHTRAAYALSLTLGFSALTCFVLGYAWLIFRVAR